MSLLPELLPIIYEYKEEFIGLHISDYYEIYDISTDELLSTPRNKLGDKIINSGYLFPLYNKYIIIYDEGLYIGNIKPFTLAAKWDNFPQDDKGITTNNYLYSETQPYRYDIKNLTKGLIPLPNIIEIFKDEKGNTTFKSEEGYMLRAVSPNNEILTINAGRPLHYHNKTNAWLFYDNFKFMGGESIDNSKESFNQSFINKDYCIIPLAPGYKEENPILYKIKAKESKELKFQPLFLTLENEIYGIREIKMEHYLTSYSIDKDEYFDIHQLDGPVHIGRSYVRKSPLGIVFYLSLLAPSIYPNIALIFSNEKWKIIKNLRITNDIGIPLPF